MVYSAVELVDIHGVQASLQAIMLGAQAHNGGFMLFLFVDVAFAQRLGHPGQYQIAKGQAAENFRKFLADNLFAHIRLHALSPVAGAMVVDIAPLLDSPTMAQPQWPQVIRPENAKLALAVT